MSWNGRGKTGGGWYVQVSKREIIYLESWINLFLSNIIHYTNCTRRWVQERYFYTSSAIFFLLKTTTQLERQVQQERTQEVRSNKVGRNRLVHSHSRKYYYFYGLFDDCCFFEADTRICIYTHKRTIKQNTHLIFFLVIYFDWSHVSSEFKYIHTHVIINFSCL